MSSSLQRCRDTDEDYFDTEMRAAVKLERRGAGCVDGWSGGVVEVERQTVVVVLDNLAPLSATCPFGKH